MSTQPNLDFDCTACGETITDPRRAVLTFDGLALQRADAARIEYRRNHPEPAPGELPPRVDLSTLLTDNYPEPVPWRAFHTACVPEAFSYHVPLNDLSSWESVIDWTAHVADKGWMTDTDWSTVLRGLIRRRST